MALGNQHDVSRSKSKKYNSQCSLNGKNDHIETSIPKNCLEIQKGDLGFVLLRSKLLRE